MCHAAQNWLPHTLPYRNRAATAQAAPQQTRQTGGAATTLVPAVTGVKTGPRPIPQAQVLATQDMSVRIQSDCCCVRGQNTATEHTQRHNPTHQIGSTAANSEVKNSCHSMKDPPGPIPQLQVLPVPLQLLQDAPTACQLAEEQAAAHAVVGYGNSCSTDSAAQGESQTAKPVTLPQQMS